MNQPLSFTDAAEKVLKEQGNKNPMHYRNIFKIALKNKWLYTEGLTPETTLTAVLNSENRRRIKRGEEPRFHAYGGGYYGLTEWLPKGIEKEIEEKNKKIKERFFEYLKKVSPEAFEKIIGEFLTKLGFENVKVTDYHGDGGIDVIGELTVGDVIKTKMAVQVKRWKNNVQAVTIRELRGSLTQHEQGLIITTSDFSKGAIKEANDPMKVPIALMNRKQLIELMVENSTGITKKEIPLLSLDKTLLLEDEKANINLLDKESIDIFGITKGKRSDAKLINLKKVKIGNKLFNSPSGAAKSICKYPVDGWHFWRFQVDGEIKTINAIRKGVKK